MKFILFNILIILSINSYSDNFIDEGKKAIVDITIRQARCEMLEEIEKIIKNKENEAIRAIYGNQKNFNYSDNSLMVKRAELAFKEHIGYINLVTKFMYQVTADEFKTKCNTLGAFLSTI